MLENTPKTLHMVVARKSGGFAAKNMIRSKIGRSWMAIRDMDIAAEIIGVSPLKTKLSAFAISSSLLIKQSALLFLAVLVFWYF